MTIGRVENLNACEPICTLPICTFAYFHIFSFTYMLNKIISFSIKNKLVIGLFIGALIIWGGYSVTRLPIDAVPDITDNQVQVITTSPSLGAPDVERLITFPIEQANSTIPGLKKIRSFSRFGLSVVTIVFEDNVDVIEDNLDVFKTLSLSNHET